MSNSMDEKTFWVTLEPIGQRVRAIHGTTVLDIARQAGVEVVAVCGGNGTCGACKVIPIEGQFSPISLLERESLQPAELQAGLRLACQMTVLSDSRVQFPPESLATLQRLQLEGQETLVAPQPVVQKIEFHLSAPSLSDLRADDTRLMDDLAAKGFSPSTLSPALFPDFSEKLRAQNWKGTLVLNQDEIISVLPAQTALYGYAVDVGTTKIAGYLVNLESGQTIAAGGVTNPQIAYGEDVISRIEYTERHADGRTLLQQVLVEALNKLLINLCAQTGVTILQVVDGVVVGNTAMHHLLLKSPVHSLGVAPFVASISQPLTLPAREIGLELAPGAYLYLPPNIAGFVGGDHVAMLLATRASTQNQTVMALDIGTNTEISLIHHGRHLTCSCASGPAFEGAHIRDGIRAIPGAIERVRLAGKTVQVQTIQNKPAIGICGSGILDVIAELRKEDLLDARGSFRKEDARLRRENGQTEFVLVPAEHTGHGRDIAISRKDVNEIQLAKAAIRSGIEALLKEAGIPAEAIDLFLIAGAFGTYLDIGSAIRIGMFPPLPLARFQQVGNAAGSGARMMLLSATQRAEAEGMIEPIEYVELTTVPDYTDIYMNAIGLG